MKLERAKKISHLNHLLKNKKSEKSFRRNKKQQKKLLGQICIIFLQANFFLFGF